MKWKRRTAVGDLPTGPKEARSSVLSIEGEAVLVAFRKHTLLPLDDCLYALRATIPHLTRSSLHRCLQRHGISQPPQVEAERTRRDWEHCAAAAFLLARKLRRDDDMWRVFRRDNLWRRHGRYYGAPATRGVAAPPPSVRLRKGV